MGEIILDFNLSSELNETFCKVNKQLKLTETFQYETLVTSVSAVMSSLCSRVFTCPNERGELIDDLRLSSVRRSVLARICKINILTQL